MVGLHDDNMCKDYADMVECIDFYSGATKKVELGYGDFLKKIRGIIL